MKKFKKGQVGRNLAAIVMLLIVVGMITGVGVLLLDKFSDAVKINGEAQAENVTVTSGIATTANDEIRTLRDCWDQVNSSDLSTAQCNVTNAEAGEISVSAGVAPGIITVNYSYDLDSTTTGRLNNARDAVADVADDWMTLVVTIVILAAILGMVIAGFAYKRR